MLRSLGYSRDMSKMPYLKGAYIEFAANSIYTNDYSAGFGIPRQLQSVLSMRGVPVNCGTDIPIGGYSTLDLIREGSVRVDPRLQSPMGLGTASRILVVSEGTNHLLYQGIEVPPVADRVNIAAKALRDYCALRKSAGWFVIVAAMTKRNHGYDGTAGGPSAALYEADMAALNRILAESYHEYADLWFDTRALVPSLQPVAPYYDDAAHPNAYGCGLIASALADFLMQNLRMS